MSVKKKSVIILVIFFCFQLCFVAQINAQEFKTIGYLPHYRFGNVDKIDFSKLTHVNISFANPDMNGNLTVGDDVDITGVIATAHDADVKVFIALAGGFLYPDWQAAWEHLMLPANKSAFISKIIKYTNDFELDGVDMDLEWSHVNEYYSPFVIELADSLKAHNLTFSVALPGTTRYADITDEALAVFDWVNMMAYDLRGPWRPNEPGPHSPYSFSISSYNNWKNQGVEDQRLTMGVPFYGYDFTDQSDVHSLTYNQIVQLDPDNANKDKSGEIYYNGIPTIQNKTDFALQQLAGIMIWELGQDNYDEFSLLDAIHSHIQSNTTDVPAILIDGPQLSPNPFSSYLNIDLNKSQEVTRLSLFDLQGLLVFSQTFSNTNFISINLTELPSGSYILNFVGAHQNSNHKVVKQ